MADVLFESRDGTLNAEDDDEQDSYVRQAAQLFNATFEGGRDV